MSSINLSNITTLLTLYKERYLNEKPLTVVEAAPDTSLPAPDTSLPANSSEPGISPPAPANTLPSMPLLISIDSPGENMTRSPLIITLKSPHFPTSMPISNCQPSYQQSGLGVNIPQLDASVSPQHNEFQSSILPSTTTVTGSSNKIYLNEFHPSEEEEGSSPIVENNTIPHNGAPGENEQYSNRDEQDFFVEFFADTEINSAKTFSSAALQSSGAFSSSDLTTSTTEGSSFIPLKALQNGSYLKETLLAKETSEEKKMEEDEIIFSKEDAIEINARMEKEDKKCCYPKRHSLITSPKLTRYEQYTTKIQNLIKIQHADLIISLKKQFIINQIKNEELRHLICKNQFK